jgi:hypothetical protein
MRKDMKNLQRKVEYLTNMLASQRIIQREVFDEGTTRGDEDQHTKHEEIWWVHVQKDREKKKEKTKLGPGARWKKVRYFFSPLDYAQTLFHIF